MAGTLIIRADSTPEIGSGHVMRCLALAQAWQKSGGNVTFVSHLPNPALRARLLAEQCELAPVETPHPSADDWKVLGEVIRGRTRPAIVLDGYNFDPEYQKRVRETGNTVLVLDDIVLHPRYECDFVLNQNVNAERLQYPTAQGTRLLLGSTYAMLRTEFLVCRERERLIPDAAQRVLVTLGGSDPDNVTGVVVDAIRRIVSPELQVRIVIGPDNPNAEQLCSQHGDRLEFIRSANMPELMMWADVAISAAGSTSWELALLGVPSLLITVAENQAGIGAGMAEHGAAVSLGQHDELNPDELARTVEAVLHDRDLRQRLSDAGRALIDGQGAYRVAAELRARA
jgi:UDP-2,4-diacetamido-2,4,6-trideoxy-beta-L-altropyranose hydrolase